MAHSALLLIDSLPQIGKNLAGRRGTAALEREAFGRGARAVVEFILQALEEIDLGFVRADGGNHVKQEAGAIGQWTTVLILAVIDRGAEELSEQVAIGGM